jgi:hypothetical protein
MVMKEPIARKPHAVQATMVSRVKTMVPPWERSLMTIAGANVWRTTKEPIARHLCHVRPGLTHPTLDWDITILRLRIIVTPDH